MKLRLCLFRLFWGAFLVLSLGVLGGGNQALADLSPDLNTRITQAQESWHHSNATFWPNAKPQFPLPNMPPEIQAQIILDRLVYVSPLRGYDIRLRIKQDPSINAFTDGKTIYLHSGLLQAMGHNQDLLASVVAHELSHIVAHHKTETKNRNADLLLQIASPIIGQLVPYGSVGTQAARELVKMKGFSYSREQEIEADAIAAILAMEAGYNPYGLSQFFDQVSTPTQSFVVPSIPTNFNNPTVVTRSVALYLLRVSPFYKTHPPSHERKHVVEQVVHAKHHGEHSLGNSWLSSVYQTVELRRPKVRR